MSEIEEKTPRYVFSGKSDDYPTWAKKYMARATMKKFVAILKGTKTLRTKTEMDNESDAAVKKEDEEISEMNSKAYNDLLLSIDTDSTDGQEAFDMVTGTLTDEYPDGNAKLAWDKLKLECEPTTVGAYVKIKTQFQDRKLKDKEKPLTWITELEKLRNRLKDMKHPLADEDFFIHIIGSLPLIYRDEKKDFKKKLDNGTLTLRYIKDELKTAHEDYYEDKLNDEDANSKEDEDVALNATGNFKGYCNNCGKYGHKKQDCPELKQDGQRNGGNQGRNGGNQGRNGGSRRFNGNCHHCGKRGHRKSECWSNPENKNKKNGGDNQNDQGDDGAANEVAEIVLMAADVPTVVTEEKKYFWYDWCQEIEEEEALEANIVVETYVLDETSERNGLRDDFFDVFDYTDGGEIVENIEFVSKLALVSGEPFDDACSSDDDSGPPPLIARKHLDDDSSVSSGDDSLPELVTRKHIDDDSSVNSGDTSMPDSLPDLVQGAPYESNSDSESDDGSDSVPSLITRKCYDASDSESDTLDDMDQEEFFDSLFQEEGYNEQVAFLAEADDESYYDGYQDDGSDTGTEASYPDMINDTMRRLAYELALTGSETWKPKDMKLTVDTWFGDSAASAHMCNDDTGMFDWKPIHEEIKVGSGKAIIATKVGKKRMRICQTNGQIAVVTLSNVKYVPGLWCNLFSLTAALDKGFNLGNKGRIITISKGGQTIGFDRIFPTNTGYIMAAEMVPVAVTGGFAVLEAGKDIDIHTFHEMYGHPGEVLLRNTAKGYDLKLKNKLEKCENCALSKSRQANVSKDPVERSTTPGERIFIDISSVKKASAGGSKFWLGILDDASDHIWSKFLKKKSDLSSTMIALIKDLKAKGYDVKIIRCDRAGENMKFQEEAIKAGLGLTFEFTASNTPQRNGRIERKFATLFGRVRSMMNSARMTQDMREKWWAEAANTATKLENALIYDESGKSSHELFWKKQAKYARYLRTFGEMAVIKLHAKIKGKLKDRGKTVMFVGYADDSSPDVYRFIDLKTGMLNTSRDVTWLNKKFGDWKGIKKVNTQRLSSTILLDDDDEPETNAEANEPEQTVTTTQNDTGATRTVGFDTSRLSAREQRNLLGWTMKNIPLDASTRSTRLQTRLATANSESGREEANRIQGREDEANDSNEDEDNNEETMAAIANSAFEELQWPDFALYATEMMLEAIDEAEHEGEIHEDHSKFREPRNFQEAWNHPDEYQREKWREAIRKEFRDMIRRGVWRMMKRRDLPNGRKCAKCKWVWKIKRNGVFRARLVVCGYSQIPGVDYQEHFAPVINDITWRILLIAMMIWKLDAWLIDIKTAFLHGEFEEGERAFMDLPTGMNHVEENLDPNEDCIELMRTAYGTVQGARQWWKKLVSILTDIGFEGGDADPCLMQWMSPHGIVFIGLYVDDCLCIGKKEALELLESKFKEHGLTVKTERELKDYLSCDVKFNKDRTKAILRQPHLLKTLREDFGDLVDKLPNYRTPGTPGEGLIRGQDGETVSAEEHKLYRSGTGKLLYLVKHSRPDIANAVRELSKVLDGPTPRAMKEMKRIIKHVLDTENLGLRIEPEIVDKDSMWRMVAFSDSDYAGDSDTRKSVSGYVIYLCGVPISWRSKAQRSVTLSSTEAEWIALSEVAKEVLFMAQVLKSMGIKIELPIVIRVDNTAAIFLSNNVTTNQRTRHVDIRTKFVMQYTGPDGMLKIIFVKGIDNDSDIMTKNVSGDLHEKHVPKMMKQIEEAKETTN